GNKVGMLHIAMRSVFTCFDGHLLEYTSNKIEISETEYLNEIQIKKWFIGGVPKFREKYYSRNAIRLFKKYIEKYGKPDVIHAHFAIWSGVIAYQISKEFNIPYLITEHSSSYGRGLIKGKYSKLLSKVLNNSQKIIGVSSGLAKDISSYTSKEIIVIGNPIDTNFFTIDSKVENNKIFSIFSLGYLTQVKGFDILINSLGNLFRNKLISDNVFLRIGGSGPELEHLKELVINNGLQNTVTFLGELNKEQVKKEMQFCNLFALPSRFETFGVVYLEAMATGKPVIASDTYGPSQIINKEVGYIIETNNQKDLQKALIDAIEKKEYWKSKENEIRNYVITNFGEIAYADKLEFIYKQILEKSIC
ncbi:MAG TPA: glycosyltransferase, partial [Bacteroidales bacterium]